MIQTQTVKVVNGALHEDNLGSIQLRGVISPETLNALKAAPYQREIMPLAKIIDLAEAIKKGKVPDIELGIRGADYKSREDSFFIHHDVFIIDGLQRVSAARYLMQNDPTAKPELGAKLHFNTDEAWERNQFRILNANRTKLSPNVLLRNYMAESAAMHMLHGLTCDKSFALGRKVCWQQRMRREELTTAMSFCKTVGRLHGHIVTGTKSTRADEIVAGLDKLMSAVGRSTLRENTRTFFDVLDACWGVRSIAYRESAIFLRASFLGSLSTLFALHPVFWKGDNDLTFFVGRDDIRKMSQFPIHDTTVISLASAGGKAPAQLLNLMIDHINSGRRNRRLQRRNLNLDIDPEEIAADHNSEQASSSLMAASQH